MSKRATTCSSYGGTDGVKDRGRGARDLKQRSSSLAKIVLGSSSYSSQDFSRLKFSILRSELENWPRLFRNFDLWEEKEGQSQGEKALNNSFKVYAMFYGFVSLFFLTNCASAHHNFHVKLLLSSGLCLAYCDHYPGWSSYIWGERQETRVKKVFPLENQTRVTKSLFISNTELQNLNIMQINQLFRFKSIRPTSLQNINQSAAT